MNSPRPKPVPKPRRSIAQTLIRKYFREQRIVLEPLPGAPSPPLVSHAFSPTDPESAELDLLTSPVPRMHTSHSKTRLRYKSPTSSSPASNTYHLSLPLSRTFVKVPTMLGRQTKKVKRRTGYARIRADPIVPSSGMAGHLLIATIPRTPLERLLHRRAISVQRWWRRMRQQLLYRKATHLNSIFRMFLGIRSRTRRIEKLRRCRVLLLRINSRLLKCILRAWRRTFSARVLGIRMRMIYRQNLVKYTWNLWSDEYDEANARDAKTIFYFRKWMCHRSTYRAFSEFCHNIDKRKQIRNYFVRKNFRAWRRLNDSMQGDKRELLAAGQRKLERRCAMQIQRVWFAYALTLVSLAANDSVSLDVLHLCALRIQKTVRGSQGRRRALNRAIAFSAVCVIFSRAWRKIALSESRALEQNMVQYEASRAVEERGAMALAEFEALKTQRGWEESVAGILALADARSVGGQEPCLPDTSEKPTSTVCERSSACARKTMPPRGNCMADHAGLSSTSPASI